MDTHDGYLPVKLTITKPGLFADAARFVAAGPLAAGFEVHVQQFGPDATGIEAAERLPRLDQRMKQLVDGKAPDVLVEALRDKRASLERLFSGLPDEQSVWFRNVGVTSADFVALVVGTAAYALASGGTIVDIQYPARYPRAIGDDILAALADHLMRWFAHADPVEIGSAFRDWDA